MTGVTPTTAMAAPASDLLRQLDDIKGLGAISIWPLAPGWWVLLILCAILFVIGIVFYLRQRAWQRSWKKDASQSLSKLEEELKVENAQATVSALSAILRRIAIRKFSRSDCAGLQGDQWLQWLQAHDPHRFNWQQTGHLLIDAPYAPPNATLDPDEVRELIRAARKWVD
jgi:hypothetical protein